MENEVMLKRIRQIQRLVPDEICAPIIDVEGAYALVERAAVAVERAAVAETTLDIMDTMLTDLAKDIKEDIDEMEANRRRWAEEDARKKAEEAHEEIRQKINAKMEELAHA